MGITSSFIAKREQDIRRRRPEITSLALAKVPPQATDMEEAVLGCCLNDNGRMVFEEVLTVITEAEAFYKDQHQKIFAAMLRLYAKGSPIDLLLVQNELGRANELEMVGGAYSLTLMAGNAVTDAHTGYYCHIIMEKYLGRELIRINGGCINEAYDEATDVFALIDKSCDAHYKLLSGNIHQEPGSAGQGVKALLSQMEEQHKLNADITGIPTGFKDLNNITNGWQNTDLIIIAARPSLGKTAFALSLALTAAEEMAAVLIFSLEMGRNQIMARMLSSMSEVPLKSILRPRELTTQEWDRARTAAATLADYPIYIDDTAAITLMEMRAKARKMKMKYGIQMIIVDYLQLMSGSGDEGNREQEISKISRGLKALAKDLEVPVIALSQLSRAIENHKGEATREPRLSDLRESGAIEQDADNVFFITNPSPVAIADNDYFKGKKIITIAKGRNIGLGTVALEFNSEIQRWRDPVKVL